MPAHIRAEVNQRIHAGDRANDIIAWLHEQPEVLEILDRHYGEEPVSSQNISNWKNSEEGYLKYLHRKERVANIKQLTNYSLELADQGRDLFAASSSIVGGQLLEVFESVDVDMQKALIKEDPKAMIDFIGALTSLQKQSVSAAKLKHAERRLQQMEERLDLEIKKFQRNTAEQFLKWYEDKQAKEIAAGAEGKDVKMDQLVQLFFGSPPEAKP
ncbi:MAG: hypothetical protein ACLFU4_10295 [Opitutales bacterium]